MFKNIHNFDDKEVNVIVRKAVDCIKNYQYDDAKELLKQAASYDVENPVVYNLLGIIYEMNRDYGQAAKYYRVAYYMDQGFKAASENLDRLNDIYYKGFGDVSWGVDGVGGAK